MFKKLYLFLTLLTAFLFIGSGTMWGETLKIGSNDGKQANAPVYTGDADRYQYHNQSIYTASELSALNGQQITKITYFQRTGKSTPTAAYENVQISLIEVSETEFSDLNFISTTGATVVYTGSIDAKTATNPELTLTSAYVYHGGNLLVDVQKTQPSGGGYNGNGFQSSQLSTYKTLYGAGSATGLPASGIRAYYRPVIQFTYEAAAPACADPTGVTATVASATSATIAWTEAGSATAWQVRTSSDGGTSWSDPVAATTNPYTLSGLTEGTTYNVQVRAKCDEELFSEWVNAESTVTPVSCPSVTGVTLSNKSYNSVTVNWAVNGTTNCDIEYKIGDGLWTESETNISATSKTFNGLVPGNTYSFRVKPNCGDDETWVNADKTYAPEWPTPGTPAISDYSDASVTATWTAATDADGYEYVVMPGTTAADWNSPTAVSALTTSLSGLTAATNYTVYVRAKYGSARSSEVSANFTTICVAPKDLVKGTVTTSTAHFSWSQNSADNQYQYVLMSGTTAANWNNGTTLDAGVREVTVDVEMGNNYTFYVRSVYGSNYSTTALSENFDVPCGTKSLPFSESFSNSLPGCWNNATYTGSAWFMDQTYSSTQGYTARYNGSNSTSYSAELKTPDINVTDDALLTFLYRNYYSYYGTEYSVTAEVLVYDGSSTTEVGTIPMTSTSFEEAIIDLSEFKNKTINIIFRAHGANRSGLALHIDDVAVTAKEACGQPKKVKAESVFFDGAQISWIPTGKETAWKLEYSTDQETWTEANSGNDITTSSFELRGLTALTTYYVRVKGACDGGAYSDVISFTPQCKVPTNLKWDSKTSSTITISWTVNSGESEWNVRYQKTGGSWNNVVVNENPYTIEGLEAGKTYNVQVGATCNESYTSSISVDTECEAKDLPWNCGFETSEGYTTGSSSSNAPICWALLNANDGNRPYIYISSSYKKSDSNGLYLSATDARAGFAILPDFDADLNTVQIEFYHKEESTSKSGNIQFGYLTDIEDADTWVELYKCTTLSTSQWTYEKVDDFSTIPADARLAFRYIAPTSTYYDAYIDDITVSLRPNCPTPTAVKASAITNNSASITWTNGGEETSWKLQYKAEDDADWTAANSGNAFTDKPFVLESLTADTKYYVQVMAVCGGANGESPWSASGEFETDCNAKSMRYEQTFASAGIPECWRQTVVGDKEWGTSTSQKTSGSYSISFGAYTAAENYADLVTPSIELDEDAQLTFQLWNDNGSYPVVGEVYIVVGTTTTKLLDIPSTSGWALQTINLSNYTGSTAKFIFRGHGNDLAAYKYIYIDDVVIEAKPCTAPGALSKDEAFDGATISWNQGGDETQYQWVCVAHDAGEPESGWSLLEDGVREVIITGKEANVQYDCYVRAYCSETKHSASQMITFTPQCLAPTALAASNITNNSATISWTGDAKTIRYKASTDEDWTNETISGTSYNFSGAANTTYQVQVQAACAIEDDEAWTASVSFTTWCDLADAAELPYEEGFSASAKPACWQTVFTSEYSTFANQKLTIYGNEDEQYAVLPGFDINLDKLTIAFDYRKPSSLTLQLGYLATAGGSFTSLVDLAAKDELGNYEVNLSTLSAPEATGYLAFHYVNTGSAYSSVTIDNIVLRKTPTCLKPGTPSATPGVGSAEISWTAGSETAWNLQYKLASVASWDGAAQVAVTENPLYELSGLEQGVSYKVRVQAACAGEDPSDWSDEASFTTNCAAISALPWYADFSVALSACWTIHAESSSSYYIPAANTSMNQLKMDGGKDGNSNNVVVLPAFSADLTNAVLSLEYKNGETGASYAKLEIGYVTDKNDASTFVIIGEAWEQNKSFKEARVALADVTSGKQIALRFAGASKISDMSIKNLRVINAYNFADNVDNSETLADLNGQTVDVTIGRTITCTGYFNTLCLPFDLSAEELAEGPLAGAEIWAFKYAKVDEATDELLFRIVEADHIEAGKPYFIQFAAGDAIENPLFKNVTISASAGRKIGDENMAQLCGILKPETFTPGDKTKLFLYNENALYWWNGASESALKSFRAYFYVNTTTSGANYAPRHGMRARIIKEEQTVTGINNTNVENVTLKFIENDQVVIIRNGVKYNIQGQVISK